MIRWTGLAPWEFEFPFPGSLTSTVQVQPHIRRLQVVHRVSSSLLGPVVRSFRALTGRLKLTVRRHKFNRDSPSNETHLIQITFSAIVMV